MRISVTRNGKVVDSGLYEWDPDSNVFYTNESNLNIKFDYLNELTIVVGDNCNVMEIGEYSVVRCDDGCSFESLSNCVFETSARCNFNTDECCTFDVSCSCDITCGPHSVIIRRDIFDVKSTSTTSRYKTNIHDVEGITKIESIEVAIDGQIYVMSNNNYVK